MKKFKKAIKIKLDVYGLTLNVLYNYNVKEVLSYVDKSDFHEGMKKKMRGWFSDGEYSRCFAGNGANNLILLSEEESMHELMNTIAHEALHFVFELAKFVNIKYSSKSEESYTYLIGYVVGEIYRGIVEPLIQFKKLKLD